MSLRSRAGQSEQANLAAKSFDPIDLATIGALTTFVRAFF
jgi:hypothetical protein